MISSERKGIYYVGMAFAAIGFLLFLSTFLSAALNFGNFDNFESRGRSMALRAFGGMALIVIGSIGMGIGRLGAAGAGLLLDPEQAEKDLEPWARLSGRLTNKTVNEIDAVDDLIEGLSASKDAGDASAEPSQTVREIIKVRCHDCEALNDEDAKFCDQCGTNL